MNIRIGNDVKLNLTLNGFRNYDLSNIKQLRCYLINTSVRDIGPEPCNIGCRFPHEPFPQFYTPTPHTLHNCGRPGYHVYPHNCKHCYDIFGCGFHDYHWWPQYRGFGLRPNKFVPADPAFGTALFPIRKPFCDVEAEFTYLAPSKIDEGVNKILVYFPASDQYSCGQYKLVVVLVVYEAGWGRSNLHTYTIDKGIVFSLVDDESGASGDLTIDVDAGQTVNDGTNTGGDNTGDNTGSNTGNNTGSNTGDNTGDNTGNNTGESNAQTITIKAGFQIAESTTSSNGALDISALQTFNATGTTELTLNNSQHGSYLWICTTKPIKPVSNSNVLLTNSVTSSGFVVPMEQAVLKDGYYRYRSSGQIVAGDMSIKIEF